MKKLISSAIAFMMLIIIFSTVGTMTAFAATTGVDALSIAGTESLYEEYDYSDPDWISDDALFGKWDNTSGTWSVESLLNYEKYPELSEVEKAAKAGDYVSAKQLITEYYRKKFLNQPRKIKKTDTTTAIINAKMLCYNMYGAGSFTNYDIVTLTKKETLVKADITSVAQSAVNSTSAKEYTFQIAATHDDGYTGYMYSRESEKGAYVETVVNGETMRFPVVADTYIRGGNYKNINYGTSSTNPENKLYMSEHTDYSKSGIGYPAKKFDWYDVNLDGIMRTRLTVNFTGIPAGATVNSAKLCFTGATDNPSGKTVVIQYRADMAGSETDTSWTWNKAYRYMMSYHGLLGTAAFSGDNSTQYDRYIAANWSAASALTGVYRYTMDETYAYHAFRYMNALVKEQGYNPLVASRGSGSWTNNLSCATRSSDIPVQLAQLATSKHFTAENFIPMLKYAYSSGQALVTCWDGQSETTNWGTYETAGLANLVVNFKEFRVVDAPIEDGGTGNGKLGGWKTLVNHRYYIISGNVIREDGSFTETMEYGRETLNNFLKYPKYADEAGESAELEAPLISNLTKLATYIINVAGPNFRSTQYGDSINYNYSFATMAKDAANATGDPFLRWAGSGKKQGIAPNYTSVLYPINRKAALKTGWNTNDLYVDFAADNTVMSHNHADDLNIGMFCYGEPLLVDSMQYSYGTNDPKRIAVYATNNHNTLSIKVTNPNTKMRENLSHYQNISGLYTGPYPVYSAYLAQDKWPNSFFNRTEKAQPGTIHRSEINNGYDYVEMSHKNYENWYVAKSGYEYARANVNMKRSLLMLREAKYMIVSDYVKALDSNDYTVAQNWHFMPGSNFTIDSNTGIAKTAFADAPNVQIIPVKAKSDMDYVYEQEGYYCPGTGVIQNNPYPAYEKSGSGDKVYNTIILPTAPGQSITSVAENLPLNVEETVASASHITMTDDNTKDIRDVYYYFLHDTANRVQRAFGKYSTDGKMALVEHYNETLSMYVIQDGTNIIDASSGAFLVNSNAKIDELSVTINGEVMELDSSKIVDLTTLAIRSDEKIKTVKLNGEEIEFDYIDNYVCFGDGLQFVDKLIDFAGEDNVAYGKKIIPLTGRYWTSTWPNESRQYATDGDMTTVHKGNGKDGDGNITGVSFTLDLEEVCTVTEFALYLLEAQPKRTIKVYSGTEVNETNLIATISSPESTKMVNGVNVYELKADINNVKTSQITVVYSGGADFGYVELYVKGKKFKKETIDFTADENIAYGKKIKHILGHYYGGSEPSDLKQYVTDGDIKTHHSGYGVVDGQAVGVAFSIDLGKEYELGKVTMFIDKEQRSYKVYKGTSVDEENFLVTATSEGECIKVNGDDTLLERVSATFPADTKAQYLTLYYPYGYGFNYFELFITGSEVVKIPEDPEQPGSGGGVDPEPAPNPNPTPTPDPDQPGEGDSDATENKTVVSSDGKNFTVRRNDLTEGNSIYLVLYDGKRVVDVKTAVYDGKTITFTTDKQYTNAKVLVWETSRTMAPLCDVEIVK